MRILVATDFTPRSQRAVRRAGVLAARHRDEVILMHVVEGLGTREVAQDLREAQRMSIEQISVVPELFRVPCEPLVIGGCPSEAILDAVSAWEIDLVVVGSATTYSGYGSGKTLKRLLRACPCPILVVRRSAEQPYQRLLAPVDLTSASSRALRSATSLKLTQNANVTVVHAFEALAKAKLSMVGVAHCHIDSYVENWRSWFAGEVDKYFVSEGFTARDWSRRIEEGPPHDVIVGIVEEIRSDLIVMGTHRRGCIMKAFAGSVTEQILSAGIVDVLVVPPPARHSAQPEWLLPTLSSRRVKSPDNRFAAT